MVDMKRGVVVLILMCGIYGGTAQLVPTGGPVDPVISLIIQFDAPDMNWEYSEFDKLEPAPYYDRFGNPIPWAKIYRDGSGAAYKSRKNRVYTKAHTANAGYFVLHYDEDDTGFEDPSEGPARRRVLEQVLEDVSDMVNKPPTDPCTNEEARVHLLINGGGPLPPNALGGASAAFDTRYGDSTALDGEVWKVLTTGSASERNLFHGFIDINFNFSFYTGTDPGSIGVSEYDLYSVLIHEVLHAMGFHSLIASSGQSVYMASLGRSFFSRFDLGMEVNGIPAVSSGSSVPLYDLVSNLSSSSTVMGCNDTRAIPSAACSYLGTDHGIFAPNPYRNGSSLSHYDPTCPDGNGNNNNYVMTFNLGPSDVRRTPEPGEWKQLLEMGYDIDGYNGEVIGGVNDDFDCDAGTKYTVEACPDSSLTIDVLNNDGETPDQVVGVRVLGNTTATATWNGSAIEFTPDPNEFGFTVVQYVPVYGCVYGNITEVLVYTIPCGANSCTSNSNPVCVTNCNADMNESNRTGSECRRLGQLVSGSVNVPHWGNMSTGRGSPDYYRLTGNNYALGILPDEGLVHRFALVAGNNYLFHLRVRSQRTIQVPCSAPNNENPIDFLTIRSGQGIYQPYDGRKYYAQTETHVSGLSGQKDTIRDIQGADIYSDDFVDITFCYTPDNDYDYLLFYYDRGNNSPSDWYVTFDEVSIRQINDFDIPDQVLQCNGNPVSVSVNDVCDFSSVLGFEWRDEQDNKLETGLSHSIDAVGGYSLRGILNGESCFVSDFNVSSTANFGVTGSVTNGNCQSGTVGSIDLSITNPDPGKTYTFQWSNGATTEDITDLRPGTYTVFVSDGNCSVKKHLTVDGDYVVRLKIIGPGNRTDTACVNSQFVQLSSENGILVDWYGPGGGLIAQNQSSIITLAVAGTYKIVRATEGDTCYVTDTYYVIRSQVTVEDTDICDGESATLTAIGTPAGGTYLWSTGATTDRIPVSPGGSGTYSYTVTYTVNGCSSEATAQVVVHPEPSLTVSADTIVICRGECARISAFCSGEIQFSGGPAMAGSCGEIPSCASPPCVSWYDVQPDSTTSYTVTCTSGFGCTTSTTVLVKVLQRSQHVPNPGFEQGVTASGRDQIDDVGNVTYTDFWFPATGSPDLFDRNFGDCSPIPCGVHPGDINCVGTPCNHFGFENNRPETGGERYAGLWFAVGVPENLSALQNTLIGDLPLPPAIMKEVYSQQIGDSLGLFVEGIEVPIASLNPANEYVVQFYVSRAEKGELGALFEDDQAWFNVKMSTKPKTKEDLFFAGTSGTEVRVARFDPVSENDPDVDLVYTGHTSVTKGWELVSFKFNPQKAYEYLIIESAYDLNLIERVNKASVTISGITPPVIDPDVNIEYEGVETYMYIDDVSIKRVCPAQVELKADAGPDRTVCHGSCTTIGGFPSATGGLPQYQYSWSPSAGLSDPNAANPVACPVVTTSYTLTVTDDNGDSDQSTVTVTVNSPVIAEAGPSKFICAGDCETIGGSPTASGGTAPYFYNWNPATDLSSTAAANPVVCPTADRKYHLVVLDIYGCRGTDSVEIRTFNPINLVQNDGFEVGVEPTGRAQIALATGWLPSTGDPDLFDDRFICTPCDRMNPNDVGIPSNYFGEQTHRRLIGRRYAGLHAWDDPERNLFVRISGANTSQIEGMQSELLQPLEPGKNYEISLVASFSEFGELTLDSLPREPKSQNGSGRIVVRLSSGAVPYSPGAPAIAPAVLSARVNSKNNWEEFKMVFTAGSAFDHIVVESSVSGFTAGTDGYVYVDDVSLIEVCGSSTSLVAGAGDPAETDQQAFNETPDQFNHSLRSADLLVYPQPAREMLTIQAKGSLSLENGRIQLFDITGKRVYDRYVSQKTNRVTLRDLKLQQGTYWLTLTVPGQQIYRHKVMIIR